MNARAQIAELQQAITNLLAAYPELAEDEVLRADMFEAETDLHEVLSSLVSMQADDDAMVAAIKLRIDDLHARKARYERRKEGLRSLIQSVMDKAGLKSVPLPEATVSLSWRKPGPVVVDEAALPDGFVKTIRKPDAAKIREAVASGQIPPGVALDNGKPVLTIRSK